MRRPRERSRQYCIQFLAKYEKRLSIQRRGNKLVVTQKNVKYSYLGILNYYIFLLNRLNRVCSEDRKKMVHSNHVTFSRVDLFVPI